MGGSIGKIFLAIGTGGLSLLAGGLGSKKSEPSPTAPAPLPQAPKVEKVQSQAEDNLRRKKAAQTKTVYTSPLGLAGQANVARKTLTGQ